MESMNDKKFDQTLKEKLNSFETNVPTDLWKNIEAELDAVQLKEYSLIEKKTPTLIAGEIKKNNGAIKFKRIIVLFGSIAAMLFITFVFLRNNNSDVIYLKPNAKNQLVKIPAEKKKSVSENTLPSAQKLPDSKKNLVSKTDNVAKETHSEKRPFAQNTQRSNDVVENRREPEVFNERADKRAIEQTITLVSVDIAIFPKEPFSISTDLPALVLQETSKKENLEISFEANVQESNIKKIGLSTVLNFLTKGLNSERENPIEFSETEEGILKWDIKSSLAKNPR